MRVCRHAGVQAEDAEAIAFAPAGDVVIAMGRGDSPLPLTTAQLATTLASEPALTGIVLDPAGPWIELDRDDLAVVLALAD